MRVIVASESKVKVEAVKKALEAYGVEADVRGVSVPSNVSEQPFDGETIRGAMNRAEAAKKAQPDADLHIAIESGLFTGGAEPFVDKAVVVCLSQTYAHVRYSDGVAFPEACVEKARVIGFETMTVGKVMEAEGLVEKHNDPHASLGSRKPRAAFIQETLETVFAKDLGWKKAQKPGTKPQGGIVPTVP